MGLAETFRTHGKKSEAIKYYREVPGRCCPNGPEANVAKSAIERLEAIASGGRYRCLDDSTSRRASRTSTSPARRSRRSASSPSSRREELEQKQQEELKKLHFMKCPKCGMDLQTLKKGNVEVDTCFNCKGVWLDAGELEQFMYGRATRAAASVMKAVLNLFKTRVSRDDAHPRTGAPRGDSGPAVAHAEEERAATRSSSRPSSRRWSRSRRWTPSESSRPRTPASPAAPLREDEAAPSLPPETALAQRPGPRRAPASPCRRSWSERHGPDRTFHARAGGEAGRRRGVLRRGHPRLPRPHRARWTGRCAPSSRSTRKAALAAAEASDRRRASARPAGALDGVPSALKDIFSPRGLETTCGSKILEGFVPPYDGTAVRLLQARPGCRSSAS